MTKIPVPESFEGQTTAPAATDVFTNRNSNGPINPTPAPGNGALPPGHNTFRVNKRKGGTTTKSYIKTIGD